MKQLIVLFLTFAACATTPGAASPDPAPSESPDATVQSRGVTTRGATKTSYVLFVKTFTRRLEHGGGRTIWLTPKAGSTAKGAWLIFREDAATVRPSYHKGSGQIRLYLHPDVAPGALDMLRSGNTRVDYDKWSNGQVAAMLSSTDQSP